jgi:hypothetical protein
MPVNLCKIGKFFLPAMFGLIFIFPQALACCGLKNSPKKELEQASFVFSGKVVNADPSYWFIINREFPFIHIIVWETYMVFSVKDVWKGEATSEVRIKSEISSVSFNFEEGEEYLVYAGGNDPGSISTSTCTRTARLIDASEDLAVLGKGSRPKPPSKKSPLPAIGSLFLGLALPVLILWIYCSNRGRAQKK